MAIEVRPDNWPLGSGYSHGFSATGRLLFVAGQIGWDPITQAVAQGLVDQIRQALANVVTVLRAGGGPQSPPRGN